MQFNQQVSEGVQHFAPLVQINSLRCGFDGECQAVTTQLVIQGAPLQPQFCCYLSDVVRMARETLFQQRPLERFNLCGQRGSHMAIGPIARRFLQSLQFGGEMLALQHFVIGCQGDQTLDFVFQLPHIAGPAKQRQRIQRIECQL